MSARESGCADSEGSVAGGAAAGGAGGVRVVGRVGVLPAIEVRTDALAWSHPHGRWIEWLDAGHARSA